MKFLSYRPVAALMFFATSALALAGGGGNSDVGGGGRVVDISGRPALRDLWDNTNCIWMPSRDFRQSLKQLPTVLESIRGTHWYLALNFEKEGDELFICETQGDLKEVPADDFDAVAIYRKDSQQIAIRLNNRVYIDRKLFDQLDETSQAFLFLHEVAHSYLPLNVTQRNQKLRSFISVIHKNMTVPFTKERFMLQLEMNSIGIATNLVQLDAHRKDIESALSETNAIEERRWAAKRVLKVNGLISQLRPIDAATIHRLSNELDLAVFEMASRNDVSGVLHALDVGADPNLRLAQREGAPPLLYWAVRQGHIELAKRLMSMPGIDLNATRGRVKDVCYSPGYCECWLEQTAFDAAVYGGRHELVELFNKAEPPVKANNVCGMQNSSTRPIINSIIVGDHKMLKLLLDRKDADELSRDKTDVSGYWGTSSLSALEAAFRKKDKEALKLLVMSKAVNPNQGIYAPGAGTAYRVTGFTAAVMIGMPDVAQMILNRDDALIDDGEYPPVYTVCEVFTLHYPQLAARMAKHKQFSSRFSLKQCRVGEVEYIHTNWFSKKKQKWDATWTPLAIAIRHNDLPAVKAMVEKLSQAEAKHEQVAMERLGQDLREYNALEFAKLWGRTEIYNYLKGALK